MMIMTVKEMNLDVVIEGAVLVAVVLEQSERVLVAKVLKLDQRLLSEPPHDRLHELVDEVVVFLGLAGDIVKDYSSNTTFDFSISTICPCDFNKSEFIFGANLHDFGLKADRPTRLHTVTQ